MKQLQMDSVLLDAMRRAKMRVGKVHAVVSARAALYTLYGYVEEMETTIQEPSKLEMSMRSSTYQHWHARFTALIDDNNWADIFAVHAKAAEQVDPLKIELIDVTEPGGVAAMVEIRIDGVLFHDCEIIA